MKTLLVGAGAVGQVFGFHLQRGGAQVGFLVKEKYAEAARAGYDLYPLNRRRPRQAPVRFQGFSVVTHASGAAAERPDVLMLCVSSTQLRGPWLDELLPELGDATVVTLQPGMNDRAYLLERVPESRLVCGMIGFISYAAPLPGETVPTPGIAYWLPPLSPCPFSGPTERVRPLVDTLNRGGLSARIVDDVPGMSIFPSALLMCVISGLAGAGWSLRALHERAHADLTLAAAHEALAVISRRTGRNAPLPLRVALSPLLFRTALGIAPGVTPLDLETYLRVHFTKVADQTQLMMRDYVAEAHRLGIPAPNLEKLASGSRSG
ncbi:MAG: 2-dehydropantoate 2-reductase N-terminal domain-containing protein [Myxococcota bacterium]